MEAEDLDDNSYFWTSSIKKERSSYDSNIVFIRARNPQVFHNGVRVRIFFLYNEQRIKCDVICNKSNANKNKNCNSYVFLHKNSLKTMENIFTSEPLYLQWLGWKMVGHPSQWEFKTPYLTFYC